MFNKVLCGIIILAMTIVASALVIIGTFTNGVWYIIWLAMIWVIELFLYSVLQNIINSIR